MMPTKGIYINVNLLSLPGAGNPTRPRQAETAPRNIPIPHILIRPESWDSRNYWILDHYVEVC